MHDQLPHIDISEPLIFSDRGRPAIYRVSGHGSSIGVEGGS